MYAHRTPALVVQGGGPQLLLRNLWLRQSPGVAVPPLLTDLMVCHWCGALLGFMRELVICRVLFL